MSGLHSSCDGDGLYSVFDFNTHFFPKCSAGLPDSKRDPADWLMYRQHSGGITIVKSGGKR